MVGGNLLKHGVNIELRTDTKTLTLLQQNHYAKHWATTPPPYWWLGCERLAKNLSRWDWKGKCFLGKRSHLVCGGDTSWKEAGRLVQWACKKIAEGREWLLWIRQCSRPGWEVRWFTDVLWTCLVPMLQSPVGSRVTAHTTQAQFAQICSPLTYLFEKQT